jgi:glycosyltransferase involved in cell wall biosynthesis
MRIGVEGRTLQGRRYGVARYLTNLLRELVGIDEENEYLVYLSEPIEPLEFSADNLSTTVLSGRGPSLAWRHLLLPRRMRRDEIDLHFSPAYFLPLIKVCPSIVVVHDLTFKVHPEWFARDWRMRFDELFWREVRKADRILTVSEHSKKDIVRFLGVEPGRVTAIPEAADGRFRKLEDERLLAAVREKYGLPERFVLTVGAIHTRRNLERLIEALALAREQAGVEAFLMIIGTPAEFSPPVDIPGTAERCGLADRVLHVEYVSEEDLLLLYNASGLFAYPSIYEGFGLPVIEAMACGVPVVCSDVTSIPEVAGDAALYFDPEKTEEIAEAISLALTDAAVRKRLESAGPERASLFSWKRTARETLEVFNEVVRR